MPITINCSCAVCGKSLYRTPLVKSKDYTCSRACLSALNKMKRGVFVRCDNCGVEFYKKSSRATSMHHFCKSECAREFMGVHVSDGEIIKLHKQGMYDHEIAATLGCSRVYITRAIQRLLCLPDRREKAQDINLRLRISATNSGRRTGVDNHRFRGHSRYTAMARGLFNSISRLCMLKRGYTCEICGRVGGDLNTHHIVPFADIIKEFLLKNAGISVEDFSSAILLDEGFIDECNLVVVCTECHKAIHKGDNPELSRYVRGSATTIESEAV